MLIEKSCELCQKSGDIKCVTLTVDDNVCCQISVACPECTMQLIGGFLKIAGMIRYPDHSDAEITEGVKQTIREFMEQG